MQKSSSHQMSWPESRKRSILSVRLNKCRNYCFGLELLFLGKTTPRDLPPEFCLTEICTGLLIKFIMSDDELYEHGVVLLMLNEANSCNLESIVVQ